VDVAFALPNVFAGNPLMPATPTQHLRPLTGLLQLAHRYKKIK
jgi:hypothetical protein